MAEEPNKYHEGKIYTITSPNTTVVYIGSTTKKLEERLKKHISNYKSFLNGKFHYLTSFELIKQNTFTITLIELYNTETKKELERREGIIMKNIPNSINKVIPGRMPREYYLENIEHITERSKQYHIDNKEHRNEQSKQYRLDNPERVATNNKKYREEHEEELAEYNKKYREDNNEKMLAYEKKYRTEHAEEKKVFHKKYYEENKAKIALQRSHKIDCPCGDTYSPQHKSRHEGTLKHKKKLLTITNNAIII